MKTESSDDLLREWLEQLIDSPAGEVDESTDNPQLAQAAIRVGDCLERLAAKYEPDSPRKAIGEESSGSIDLGHFRILRALGRGGMATVYLAFDPRIQRSVALKVPHPGLVIDKRARRRFLLEARAAGCLNHPNIVRVYETGEIGAVCYIAYEHVEGQTLADWFADQVAPLPYDTAAQLIIQVCKAVRHAHERGIVHRDLKPSNVLLEIAPPQRDSEAEVAANAKTQSDPPTVRVTDFGLALMLESQEGLTVEGSRVGTAEYMSPEQIQGGTVGPASDQFTLGVMLYELITGETPFRRDSVAQTIQAVANEYPNATSKRRGTPKDLAAIIDRALNKLPERRYASVDLLIEDLKAFREGRTVTTRPVSSFERFIRWSRRHPSIAAAVLAIVLSVSIAASLLIESSRQLRETNLRLEASLKLSKQHQAAATTAKELAETERERAEAGERRARRISYTSDMKLITNAINNRRLVEAKTVLERQRPNAGQSDIRGPEWWILNEHLAGQIRRIGQHNAAINELVVFPCKTKAATLGSNGTVKIWDLPTVCKLIAEGHAQTSPAHIFNQPIQEFEVGSEQTFAIDVSPNGQQIATVGPSPFLRQRQVILMDLKTGQVERRLAIHNTTIESIRYSPSGDYLLTASRDDFCAVHALKKQSCDRRRQHHSRNRSLDFDHLGRSYFAGTGDDHQLCEVDLVTGEILRQYDIVGVDCFAASAATSRVVAYSQRTNSVNVFDHQLDPTCKCVAKLSGVDEWCQSVAVNSDGTLVAAGTRFGWVHRWRLTSDADELQVETLPRIKLHSGRIDDLEFLADASLLSCGADGQLVLSRTPSPRASIKGIAEVGRPRTEQDRENFVSNDASVDAREIEFSPDGQNVTWAGSDHKIRMGTMDDGQLPRKVIANVGKSVVAFDVSRNQQFIAAVTVDGVLHVFDRDATPASVAQFDITQGGLLPDDRKFAVKVSSDGKTVYTSNRQRYILCWDVESAKAKKTLSTVWSARFLELTDDESLLLAAHSTLRIFDTRSLRQVTTCDGGTNVTALLQMRDHDVNMAITGHVDGSIKVWNVDSGQLKRLLTGTRAAITAVAWTPTTNSLIAGQRSGHLAFWQLPEFENLGRVRVHATNQNEFERIVFGGESELILLTRHQSSPNCELIKLPVR